MAERINKLYKPAELVAAIEVLRGAGFRLFGNEFDKDDSVAIVKDLHSAGYRIVKVDDK